jgi:VPDSG-CTERM motif
MKSLKYIALIGLLCAGLTTLARATVTDLGEVDLPNNGDATELQGFIDAGGDADAVLCFKSVESGSTDFGGSIDISVNADNTLHVEWDMTGTGHLVCGFSTKDGKGNLVHYYSVDADQGGSGEADLIVPGNGAKALSHLDVFCCTGSVTTPDSGTAAALLGLGLTGIAGLRARFGRK